MFSVCRFLPFLIPCVAVCGAELRVCADPNNLPFSNREQKGFENEIARLIAQDLGRTVAYTWWPSREDFYKKTINAGLCDVVIGVPVRFDEVASTRPYYRSTYVFVSRRDRNLHVSSLNDPILKTLKIGVHVVSDDGSNLPPAQALANRGLLANMTAYRLYGDFSRPNPPAALMDAVINHKVDIAIMWGPLAGYFANQSGIAFDIVPVSPQIDRPYLPFTYEIAMGVRKNDANLKAALESIIGRERLRLRQILERYGVPLIDYE